MPGWTESDGFAVNPPHSSDADFRVLHAMRCIGVASEDRVAIASGIGGLDTAARLRQLSGQGLVALGPGPFGGWGLTDAGRTAAAELLRNELAMTEARGDVRNGYDSFMDLNSKLLQVCTDWQMCQVGSTHVLNDHLDADYDARVLSRLLRIDGSAQRICEDLARRLERFGVYGSRLASALEKALAGDTAYVTDSLESYHSVWFQLHEDLLVTLGISREAERRNTSGAG